MNSDALIKASAQLFSGRPFIVVCGQSSLNTSEAAHKALSAVLKKHPSAVIVCVGYACTLSAVVKGLSRSEGFPVVFLTGLTLERRISQIRLLSGISGAILFPEECGIQEVAEALASLSVPVWYPEGRPNASKLSARSSG